MLRHKISCVYMCNSGITEAFMGYRINIIRNCWPKSRCDGLLLILAFESQGRRITMSSGSSYASCRHPDPNQNNKESEIKKGNEELSSKVEGYFQILPMSVQCAHPCQPPRQI